ncbi:MAG TPA: GAF domain-containing protein [Terriglobales bacterium]|nr:GAF domain-containing protein [Terriglobales bacterium]
MPATAKSFATQVTEIAEGTDLSNSLTAPLKIAIDKLLQSSAEAVGSAVASVLVRDGNQGGLKFLTATSGVTDKLLALRLPPGAGIAGLVLSTNQPMAVADVSQEGSFWSEADRSTGFRTVTVLATPLRSNNEMVGVLEFVNRPGEPPYPPFTPAEMDHGARFADPIARLVDVYEMAQLVESLFNRSIKDLLQTSPGADSGKGLREWLNENTLAGTHRDLAMLWISVHEIVMRGDAERELCRDLLQTLARFTEKRSGSSFSFGF